MWRGMWGLSRQQWQVWAATPFAFAQSPPLHTPPLYSTATTPFAFAICCCRHRGLDTHCAAQSWNAVQFILNCIALHCDAVHCNVTESCQWCVCVHCCWSCSIPKARWKSRRVVTQLARPLLSTGQNNYVLEWKPSLQGRDGPRNGCKRYLGMSLKYFNLTQILQYLAQIYSQWKCFVDKLKDFPTTFSDKICFWDWLCYK